MSKCNFECDCKGNGKCCVECEHIKKCDTICQLIDKNKPIEYLKQDMNNCDWYEK